MSILNRIRYVTQRSKRQEMLNRYGFYETIETYNAVLIWTNSPFGVEMPKREQCTSFHIHTMLDCPFLIKPHYEDHTAYSCQLLLNRETYNIELKELINLLEKIPFADSFADWQDTPLLLGHHFHCECMEWTGHISSNFLQSGWTHEDDTEVQKLDSTKQIETPMQQIEIWQARSDLRTNQWQGLMETANQHELNQHVETILENECQIQGRRDQMRITELLWIYEEMPKEPIADVFPYRKEYLQPLLKAIDKNPVQALQQEILHLNDPEMKEDNEDQIEGMLSENSPEALAIGLKRLILQTNRKYLIWDPYR